jgi:hypothetical protein
LDVVGAAGPAIQRMRISPCCLWSLDPVIS